MDKPSFKKHCVTLPKETEVALDEIKEILIGRGEDIATVNTSYIIRVAIRKYLELLRKGTK